MELMKTNLKEIVGELKHSFRGDRELDFWVEKNVELARSELFMSHTRYNRLLYVHKFILGCYPHLLCIHDIELRGETTTKLAYIQKG